MTKLTDLAMMQKLVDLKYRKQKESFARLMAQEDRLRAALRQLDIQMAESRSSADQQQRAIGADVVWQAWVGRKKREINIQLAQVLAIKEQHIAQVRTAYGKVLVTDALFGKVSTQTQQKKARSQLDRVITDSCFKLFQ